MTLFQAFLLTLGVYAGIGDPAQAPGPGATPPGLLDPNSPVNK